MKFLTDENIGFKVINPLRKNGFDIKSILETTLKEVLKFTRR